MGVCCGEALRRSLRLVSLYLVSVLRLLNVPTPHCFPCLRPPTSRPPPQSLEIFESMERKRLPRDAITYSATISSLAKGKQWHAALQLFEHMKARDRPNKPTTTLAQGSAQT